MQLPKELEGIGIDDKRGARWPGELGFVDQDGRAVKLGDYAGDKPFILVLAYYQCPMLCSLVLNRVTEIIRDLAFDLGDTYRVVTVSFDPRDTPRAAADKRAAYVEALGKGKPVAGLRPWDFLTDAPGAHNAKALADTVGFHYQWQPDTDQFAHAAGVFLFTKDGRLSRVFYGIDWKTRDVRLGLVDASEGKLGSAWDRVLLFCYHYEPRGYAVAIVKLMRYGAGVTVAVLVAWLLRLWRRERRARRHRTEHAPA
jgi:protein SCO1/2